MESARITGRVLRIARIANDYTRKEAADRAEITSGYIAEVENGKKPIGRRSLEKLAKAYNMTYFQLMSLIHTYTKYELDEQTRYQLTFLNALEMLVENKGYM